MPVDSFRYLPRSFRAGYEGTGFQEETTVWSPLGVPIEEATVALLTSAGIYLADSQEPFDVEREKREPNWGDPTWRSIPRTVQQADVAAEHLHINTRDLLIDFNVALPIRAFEQLAADGAIGDLADEHYGFMGFQESGAKHWRAHEGPEIAQRLKDAGVHALVLAPA